MGLNPRGRGRGRGNKANFQNKGQRGGGMMGQRPMFRPAPPGMFGPPVGFPPQAPFTAPSNFGGPSGFNFRPPRPPFGKFPRNNFKKKIPQRNNGAPVPEIDLTKPWVNEEIKNEETKKQELLQIWRKTKSDEDWSNYKAQKLTVQSLYDKAKENYASSHPNEAVLWEILPTKNYYCESCDKSFRTDDDFYLHEAEHEICGRDGCEFTAHPKIVSKHIKMQHLTGLYKRIGKLYSEEDIAKWIEERKKRYPTRKVVEEKKILEEEKISRGERVKDNDSKFNKQFSSKNRGSAKKNFEKKTQKRNKRRTRKKKTTSVVQKCLEEEVSTLRKGVPAFSGIKNGKEPEIAENEDLNISDDEWETENKFQSPTKPVLNNSLGLLATFYDSEEENQNEKCIKETKVEVLSADEGSGPEEVATVSCKNPLANENSVEEKYSRKRKLSEKKYNQERKRQNTSNDSNFEKRDLTLLEKLLKKEIRHERNVILQCVHYVVKNNFFKS